MALLVSSGDWARETRTHSLKSAGDLRMVAPSVTGPEAERGMSWPGASSPPEALLLKITERGSSSLAAGWVVLVLSLVWRSAAWPAVGWPRPKTTAQQKMGDKPEHGAPRHPPVRVPRPFPPHRARD